jgi:hypothetical protein
VKDQVLLDEDDETVLYLATIEIRCFPEGGQSLAAVAG